MPKSTFIQRKDTRKDGTAQLYIRLVFHNKDYKISTGVQVKPEYFDPVKQMIKRLHPNSEDLNLLLQKQMARVNNTLIRFRLSGEPLTVDSFRKYYHNDSAMEDFLSFWENEMYE
ncbi:MAG: Arm DNA-binding domain-containing protein [Bacteroidota bacterium]